MKRWQLRRARAGGTIAPYVLAAAMAVLEDMAPTALELFGIRPPRWMEGTPVLRFSGAE